MGTAIICCVGTNSRAGMTEEKLNTEEDDTPLQEKLGKIANILGTVGFVSCFIAMIGGLANMFFTNYFGEQRSWFGSSEDI
jgi:magnesium-transporting ATPase (P-type)